MRQKRAKAYKRLMTLYSQTFGFRQPFQVLIAHDFLLELSNKQLDVAKQLSLCVQNECKPMITQCSVEALYKLGKEYQPVVDIAKGFERRRCNHREAVAEDICIKETVGPTNKHRYTMAMQSGPLRAFLRSIPGVPIIHFNDRGVMVVEMPSDATERYKAKLENARMTEQLVTHQSLPNVVSEAGPSTLHRRKAPKAPNPLSLKKKKVDKPQPQPPRQPKPVERDASPSSAEGSKPKKRAREEVEEEVKAPEPPAKKQKSKVEVVKPVLEKAVVPEVDAGGAAEGLKKRKRKRKRKAGAGAEEGGSGDDGEGSD